MAQNLIPEEIIGQHVVALKEGEQDVTLEVSDLTSRAGCGGHVAQRSQSLPVGDG